jgi:1-acyl-sn-glycerol-3-phosphate acyltransferase
MTQTATGLQVDRGAGPAAPFADAPPFRPLYVGTRAFGKFVFAVAMNVHTLHAEIPNRRGAFILALTHLSHAEPFTAAILMRRQIDWMTRKEFFKYRIFAWLLKAVGCFKVNRQGIPVSALRIAIARLGEGRVVGICPEGGVAHGKNAAIRGGAIKRGVCSAAIRAGAPIVPCVILGTHELNNIRPWLPIKSGQLYVAYGDPIYPPAGVRSTRASRQALGEQISRSYQDLYAELRAAYNLDDDANP